MTIVYTGNEAIDQYLRQNIRPTHITSTNTIFLDYLQKVGSKEEIDYVMTQYFTEKRLSQYEDLQIIDKILKLGYCIKKFTKHKNPDIRALVVKNGHSLNILINDPDPNVRIWVAQQGYGLDILTHDTDIDVRSVAKTHIKKAQTTELFY